MIISKTVAKSDTRVIIKRDFSVNVPEGMTYSTDKREINQNRLLVFVKMEENDVYKKNKGDLEEFDFENPFAAPECFTIMEPNTKLGLVSKETARGLAENILSFFEGEFTIFKETDDMMIYYQKSARASTQFTVLTSVGVYHGQIWINDVETEEGRNKIVEEWLGGLENYILTDEDKQPSPPFEKLTYNEKKSEQVGTITVGIADSVKTVKSGQEDYINGISTMATYELLNEEFAILGISKDFEMGFDSYSDAPFSINCRHENIRLVPQLAEIMWTENTDDFDSRKNTFTDVIKKVLHQHGKEGFEAYYKELGEKFAVVYSQMGESEDDIEYWCSYIVSVLQDDIWITFNVYVNAARKDKTEFIPAIEEWIGTMKIVSPKEIEVYKEEYRLRVLGKHVAEDGKVDAIRAAQFFMLNMVFNNDDKIVYDGKHHKLLGIQFNSEGMDDNPTIKDNIFIYRDEIMKVIDYVEQNENLIIPKELFHKNLLEITRKRDITGTSIFDFCAWHMLIIDEEKTDYYKVVLNENLVKGLPQCYKFVAEFIKTLREYNGKKGKFTVVAEIASIMDGPVESISRPVFGAAKSKEKVEIKVSKNEHPFSGVCKKLKDAGEEGVMSDEATIEYFRKEIKPVIDEHVRCAGNMYVGQVMMAESINELGREFLNTKTDYRIIYYISNAIKRVYDIAKRENTEDNIAMYKIESLCKKWELEYNKHPDVKRMKAKEIKEKLQIKKNNDETDKQMEEQEARAEEHMEKVCKECRDGVETFAKNLEMEMNSHISLIRKTISDRTADIKKELDDAESKYKSIGFFKFSEKSEAKKIVKDFKLKVSKYEMSSEIINQGIDKMKKAAQNATETYKKDVENYLDRRFPDCNRALTKKELENLVCRVLQKKRF